MPIYFESSVKVLNQRYLLILNQNKICIYELTQKWRFNFFSDVLI